MKIIIKEYYLKYYAHKFDDLDEINNFLKETLLKQKTPGTKGSWVNATS